jgi:ribonuclease P protein subunit RPR2
VPHRGRKSGYLRKIANERIDILLEHARMRAARGEHDIARIYVRQAWRLAEKYNIRLRKRKMWLCRNCWAYLVPGVSARIRLRREKVSITCLLCGTVKRYPYMREKHGRYTGDSSGGKGGAHGGGSEGDKGAAGEEGAREDKVSEVRRE